MSRTPTAAEIAALPYRLGVGVMQLNRDGRVFAGQRRDSALPAWQMPQGGIDPGEDPRAAALRELEEDRKHKEETARLRAEDYQLSYAIDILRGMSYLAAENN